MPVTKADNAVVGIIEPGKILDFGIVFFHRRRDSRKRCGRPPGQFSFRLIGVELDAVNSVGVGVKIVVTFLERNIQSDDQAGSHPNGKPQQVDKREKPLIAEVSPGDF